jgi:hypothetical protein
VVSVVASKEKCTKLFALIAEKNVKSHSNQAETDLFIAGIVLGRGKDFS